MRPYPTKPARRLAAGLLCLGALLLGLFAEGLHFALNEHHYCVEHQALEHGDGASDSATAHAEKSADPAGMHVAPGAGSTVHEACELPPFSREDELSFTAVREQPRSWGPVPAPLPPAATERAPSIPRHRIAPKQSPPVG